jgi:hypothetical protein
LHRHDGASRGVVAPVTATAVAPRYSGISLPRAFLPRGIIPWAMVLALTFCAFGLALSYLEGIPFTAPVLGKMPGVSMTYWVPLIAAIIGYLLLQIVAAFVGRALGVSHRSWGQVLRNAVDDYLLLGLFVLVVYVHFNMKMWVPLINPHLFDQDYYAVDQALQPLLDSFFAIRQGIARFLPAADVWYLAGYMSIFVLSFLSHALGDRRWHYHNLLGLLISQILGPLSYLIAPAVGPFIYEHGASVLATHTELRMYDVYQQVRQGGAAWIAEYGGHFFTFPLAAMPSLHVGTMFVMVYYAVRARLWVAPITVVAFAWIFIESVAARWHYLIDLPFGLLLAFLTIAISNQICGGPLEPGRRHGR